MLLTVISFYSFGYTPDTRGDVAGLWLTGTFIYFCVVLMVNIKIMNSTNTHSFGSVFFVVGSIASFFAVYYLQSLIIFFPQLYGLFPHQFEHSQFYTLTIFLVGVVVVIDQLNYHAAVAYRTRELKVEKIRR